MRSVHPGFVGRVLDRVLTRLGPANAVTAVRAGLVLVVAVLVGASPDARWPIAGLSAVTLVLDGVDGWVARRTGTATPFGARFDMEVDALLVLVLAVHVASHLGLGWVLLIGAARYLLAAAAWVAPWLGSPVPTRYWRKVVAVQQVLTLVVAGAGIVPHRVAILLLGAAGFALTVSFGSQVWEVRSARPAPSRPSAALASGLALLLTWAVLAVPDDLRAGFGSMVQVPVELLLAGMVVVLTRGRARAGIAAAAALLLALTLVVKAADLGFRVALGRPFDPPTDLTYAGSAAGLTRDSLGRVVGTAVLVLALALALLVVVVVGWAGWRTTRLVATHPAASGRALVVGSGVWVVAAVLGVHTASGTPVAGTTTLRVAAAHLSQLRGDLADRERFARLVAADPLAGATTTSQLGALRGKDVLVVFVESYGRYAVEGSPVASGVSDVLRRGTDELAASGFSARSGFLTSPTFGGISWLAHSTLQAGLWVDSQGRYDQLLTSHRTTLTGLFARSGWRTVCDVPANRHAWSPARTFYHCDQTYDARTIGYRGPAYGYPPVPDQFTLASFARDELRPGHLPVMAEIDLVTSHAPWSPLPPTLPPDELGDGSPYAAATLPPAPPGGERAAYGAGIEYSLSSLVSFVTHAGDPDLVLVVLGDHQPNAAVSGSNAGHDVPVSVIAHDPDILSATDAWGWTPGLLPRPDAPVWPMDTFRERFLTAYRTR